MSFHAQLLIQNEIFTLRQFSWAIDQQADALGRPSARTQGGTLELVLDAQPSAVLHAWATHDTQRFNGVIQVLEADSEAVRDHVAFFEAHCVLLSKQFQADHAAGGMTMHLTLSANKLQLGETELHNHWPDAQ